MWKKNRKHKCEGLKFEVHMPPLGKVKVHWLDDRCLNSSAIFGACLHWIVAQIPKYQYLQRATPMGKRTCFLAQVLMTFNEVQIHREVLFSFIYVESKSNRVCTYLFFKYIRITMPRGDMMVRGGDLEHYPSKKCPLKSPGAITCQGDPNPQSGV